MKSEKKILLTAFDPFGDDKINSALETLEHLPDKVDGDRIIKLQLPTVFGKSSQVVKEAIQKEEPDAVVLLGMAGGRTAITPERVAINVDDARIEDNEGNRPLEQAIVLDGPKAYFSTLPIQEMVAAMLERGIPASISNTAGTFVCNHLMYSVLHYLARNQQNLPAGFIHLPYLPVQVLDRLNIASMSLETMVGGIGICLDVLAKNLER